MNGLEVYPAAFTDGRNPTKLGTRSNRRIQHQATGQSKQHCDRYRLAGRQAGLAADSEIPATVAKVPWRQITKHRKQDRKLHPTTAAWNTSSSPTESILAPKPIPGLIQKMGQAYGRLVESGDSHASYHDVRTTNTQVSYLSPISPSNKHWFLKPSDTTHLQLQMGWEYLFLFYEETQCPDRGTKKINTSRVQIFL